MSSDIEQSFAMDDDGSDFAASPAPKKAKKTTTTTTAAAAAGVKGKGKAVSSPHGCLAV